MTSQNRGHLMWPLKVLHTIDSMHSQFLIAFHFVFFLKVLSFHCCSSCSGQEPLLLSPALQAILQLHWSSKMAPVLYHSPACILGFSDSPHLYKGAFGNWLGVSLIHLTTATLTGQGCALLPVDTKFIPAISLFLMLFPISWSIYISPSFKSHLRFHFPQCLLYQLQFMVTTWQFIFMVEIVVICYTKISQNLSHIINFQNLLTMNTMSLRSLLTSKLGETLTKCLIQIKA